MSGSQRGAAGTKESVMKVLVLGATGGSGRAAVEHLLAAGHNVTVFARTAVEQNVDARAPQRLRYFQGDALDPAAVEQAVAGHDAVVVTLGIRENALRVRLLGPARTPLDVRSAGTRHVIAAMRKHGVRRLVVQTTYGVGETRDKLGLIDRLFFTLILKPQIADTELQNQEVSASDLDWVIAQPVHLTDAEEDAAPFVSTAGETKKLKVSRGSVGRFLADAVASPAFVRKTVSVSGAALA
jgi:putative NADH-flavin reductase